MPIFSSRTSAGPTHEQVVQASMPARNLLKWLSTVMVFPDDSQEVVLGLRQLIEDALECLALDSFVVVSMPSPWPRVLEYEIGVKPFENGKTITFRAHFKIV